jgi:hypothetical protein
MDNPPPHPSRITLQFRRQCVVEIGHKRDSSARLNPVNTFDRVLERRPLHVVGAVFHHEPDCPPCAVLVLAEDNLVEVSWHGDFIRPDAEVMDLAIGCGWVVFFGIVEEASRKDVHGRIVLRPTPYFVLQQRARRPD